MTQELVLKVKKFQLFTTKRSGTVEEELSGGWIPPSTPPPPPPYHLRIKSCISEWLRINLKSVRKWLLVCRENVETYITLTPVVSSTDSSKSSL